MEFRQLEVFIAVAEYKSFSKAAEALFLTQSTVSSHIKNLEMELQKNLISRTTKSLQLTDDGICFLNYVKRILETRDAALNQLNSPSEALLHVGASTIPSGYLLPGLVSDFCRAHPNITFDLKQGDSMEIMEKILNGSVEIGLIGTPSSSAKCISIPFCKDEMVLVTPASEYYRKYQKNPFNLQQLLQEPLIIREQGSGTQKTANQILDSMQISRKKLNIIAQSNDLESIKRMIAGGMGISLCSRFSVKDMEEAGNVLVFPLQTPVERHFYIIYLKTKILKPSLQEFISFAQNYFLPVN